MNILTPEYADNQNYFNECPSDDYDEYDNPQNDSSIYILMKSFSERIELSDSPQQLNQILNCIDSFFNSYKKEYLAQILSNNNDFFSNLRVTCDKPDCFITVKKIIKTIVRKSLENTNNSLIQLLERNGIIEKLYSIWISIAPIDVDILYIFSKIIKKNPEYKQFFIDKKTLIDLFQFIQNYNNNNNNNVDNAIITINVCKFFANFFRNNNCSLIEYVRVIREITILYDRAYLFSYNDDKDIQNEIILKLWKSCIKAMDNFVNEPSKSRSLINLNFPSSLFRDLNSNDLFRFLWSKALPLILKMFRSEHENLDELADKYIDLFVFLTIIEEKIPSYLINVSQILIALIDINPSKYSPLLISKGIMKEIFTQTNDLSFKEFKTITILYYNVFMNVTRNDAFTHLLDQDFIEKLVEVSGVERDPQAIKYLKELLIIMYEITDNTPEIQSIIDAAFEEDGILYKTPKPLLI